ncbi:hypothetical protein TH3_17425 [Thalassospira xiamenensis M-5 = DSM 17429]|uniref:JAB domain-containing protein n=1 Tax=Thalassospira xiamenensis M-5 = DSM 17429 TaxID=1123366 RepID=A0AB72UHH7_9PROT|nr:hypothetical protein TH3_17425 [Thalassospira xiamenensis M-5 = DSM 17429]
MSNLLGFRQVKESDTEAGGLLLGLRKGPHFHLTHLTSPTKTDRRTRYSFERDKFYHSYVTSKLWNETEGQVRYLGEWHTHPENDPTPSCIDISEWIKLAKNRVDKEPMVAVIVGINSLIVELVFENTQRIRLIPSQ